MAGIPVAVATDCLVPAYVLSQNWRFLFVIPPLKQKKASDMFAGAYRFTSCNTAIDVGEFPTE